LSKLTDAHSKSWNDKYFFALRVDTL
jgi:hypothetical protein